MDGAWVPSESWFGTMGRGAVGSEVWAQLEREEEAVLGVADCASQHWFQLDPSTQSEYTKWTSC